MVDRESNGEDSRSTIHNSRLVTGTVTRQLPSGLYEIEVDGQRVTAHIGGGLERNFVRLLVGDRVTVELTPNDLRRGRVVSKGDRR